MPHKANLYFIHIGVSGEKLREQEEKLRETNTLQILIIQTQTTQR